MWTRKQMNSWNNMKWKSKWKWKWTWKGKNNKRNNRKWVQDRKTWEDMRIKKEESMRSCTACQIKLTTSIKLLDRRRKCPRNVLRAKCSRSVDQIHWSRRYRYDWLNSSSQVRSLFSRRFYCFLKCIKYGNFSFKWTHN